MTKAIYFDMDGTIADLYGSPDWLDNLEAERTKPYREAKALVDMRNLGKTLNNLQKMGYHIGIISWLSKCGSDDYNARVTKTKLDWLKRHISSVEWDEIKIVPYGSPKSKNVEFPNGILFDDEKRNRQEWPGMAFDVNNILYILNCLR